MQPLVECIPNFSEGRRPEVIAAIADVFYAHPVVRLLDIESDADHNRSVFSFVAPPEAMVPVMFDAIKTAAALIDLNEHHGAHPRMGATDVVPFVPLRDVDMATCVALARELGQRVGAELGIPVYLYEEAATRPDRVNLADVRRGQYEGLKSEIGSNPDRFPDFGPAHMGPAGATRDQRPGAAGGAKRLFDHLERRCRPAYCESGAPRQRRAALRQGARHVGQRQGAGQHESD